MDDPFGFPLSIDADLGLLSSYSKGQGHRFSRE
jgi:hypothetical protein